MNNLTINMEIIVRKATLDDLLSIVKLNKALFDYETKYNDDYNLDYSYSEKGKAYFTRRIESKDAIVLVAEENIKIVGYILVFITSHAIRKVNPIAEIENFFVSENYRSKGIGRKLVEDIKNIIKNRGIKRLRVAAMAENIDGVRFYKSLGFTHFEVVMETNLE